MDEVQAKRFASGILFMLQKTFNLHGTQLCQLDPSAWNCVVSLI